MRTLSGLPWTAGSMRSNGPTAKALGRDSYSGITPPLLESEKQFGYSPLIWAVGRGGEEIRPYPRDRPRARRRRKDGIAGFGPSACPAFQS